jgi:hypothetical protein
MPSFKSVVTKQPGVLAGDACLVSAAAFGVVMGALGLIFVPREGQVAAVLVVFAIGVALWTAGHGGDGSGEAVIFAMLAGVGAAMSVTGAEVATSLAARRKLGAEVAGS